MKGYIILQHTITNDENQDNIFDCSSCCLGNNIVYKTKEEVITAREELIEITVNDLKSQFEEPDYEVDVSTHKPDDLSYQVISIYTNNGWTEIGEILFSIWEVEF